jgi:SAM-dependent methyltransferase
VPPGVRVLDIGCGFGEALGYYRSRGCDAYGVEADGNVVKVAEKFGYNICTGLFDSSLYKIASFDYVTMDQVIEHVSDPVEMLRDVADVLKPSGLLVLSTPNPEGWGARLLGSYWVHWHIPYHQHFFSYTSMRIAADRAGFELVSGKTVTHSSWLRYQWAHLYSRPPAGTPSTFWSPKIRKTLIEKIVFGALKLMHYSLLNHILTRLADMCNAGDNRIYVFRKKLAV